MLVHLLYGKEINPSSLDSVDLFQYFLYLSTVCAIGLLIRPTLGANVNKGFNYSWDVPGIACCCPVNPSSSLISSTKRHLFPGERGEAVQGSLCWPGFVWERALGEWQPGLKISFGFWELSFPSKLLRCCNLRSQVFPLTGNGATFWGRTRGSKCQAWLTGSLLIFYRARTPRPPGSFNFPLNHRHYQRFCLGWRCSVRVYYFPEIYFPTRSSYCKTLEVCVRQMIMLSSNLSQRKSLQGRIMDAIKTFSWLEYLHNVISSVMPRVPSQEWSHLHKDTLRQSFPQTGHGLHWQGRRLNTGSLILLLQSGNLGTQAMQGSCGAADNYIRHCNSSFHLKFRLRGPHSKNME